MLCRSSSVVHRELSTLCGQGRTNGLSDYEDPHHGRYAIDTQPGRALSLFPRKSTTHHVKLEPCDQGNINYRPRENKWRAVGGGNIYTLAHQLKKQTHQRAEAIDSCCPLSALRGCARWHLQLQ